MSHSVFKDLDEGSSKAADTNLIVFIDKDGDVTVDQSALQDLIVNANTEKKTTVSVIRVGSPTPSMNSAFESDADEDDDDDEELEDEEEADSENSNSDGKERKKLTKRKDSVPRIALTVENFYNPDEANKFAEEIMNIAGITDPRQLKVDFDYLRNVIANDHCYTTLTMVDHEEKEPPKTQKIAKETTKSSVKTALKQLSTPKKTVGRPAKGKPRNVSDDDEDSDTGAGENEDGDGEDSEPDDEESDTDFSDMTDSDSDNDRDSDLDFNVNDRSMSKRPRKSKKKRAMAKAKRLEKATRKRRNDNSAVDVSDPDVATPGRKKSGKMHKRTPPTRTPTTDASPSGSVKSAKTPTIKVVKQSQRDKLINILRDSKEPVVVLKKHSITPQATVVQSAPATVAQSSPARVVQSPPARAVQSPPARVVQSPPARVVQSPPASAPPPSIAENTKPFGMAKREKKTSISDTVSLFTSPDIIKQVTKVDPVRTPKVYANVNLARPPPTTPAAHRPLSTTPTHRPLPTTPTHRPLPTSMGFVHLSPQQGAKNRNIPTQISVRVHASPASTANATMAAATPSPIHIHTKLASEQDKQLDLIDSIVQQELYKSDNESHRTYSSVKPSSTITSSLSTATTAGAALKPPPKILNHTLTHNEIPDIVKMLETSTAETNMCTQSATTNLILNSTLAMPTVSTELQFSTNITNDANLLDVNLLDSLSNTDDGLIDDDLMKHVAQLAEDENLQKILDAQVLSVTSAACITPNKPITTLVLTPQSAPVLRQAEKESPFVKLAMQREAQKAAQASAARATGPITIVRPGGRVITLPPIEAPATRGAKRRAEVPTSEQGEKGSRRDSKESSAIAVPRKLSADIDAANKLVQTLGKVQDQDRRGSSNKRISTEIRTPKRLSVASANNTIDDYDDEDDDEKSDGSYNSEDDPLRLWCICRQPHNNRFMICCDKCEEWFHGKCVNITKPMGTEMEQRGAEWVCPNCIKKQQPSVKDIFGKMPKSTTTSTSPATSPANPKTSELTPCVVCKKPARHTPIYCSEECIVKHMTSTTTTTAPTTTSVTPLHAKIDGKKKTIQTTMKREQPGSGLISPNLKNKSNHVVVYDKRANRYISGKNAPTEDVLHKWLNAHPAFEVVKTGTALAEAFKAKQMQLKQLANDMSAKSMQLTMPSQPPKLQTTLKVDGSKKIVVINPNTGAAAKLSPGNQLRTTPKLTKIPQNVQLKSGGTPSTTNTPKQQSTKPPSASSSSGGHGSKKRQSDTKSTPRSSNNEVSIRINVRSTLKENLMLRTAEVTQIDAVKLTEDEITNFAKEIEHELFAMFNGETAQKYRNKYRSLIFNIKDKKNQTLFQKISKKLVSPKQLVRMSPEELASQELAKWRENENKHQLEMIKKSELDNIKSARSFVLKTHKGEEVIESRGTDLVTIDPLTAVEDVVSVLNNSMVSSSSETTAAIANDNTTTTPLILKDIRFDKYLGVDSTSVGSKSDASGSKKKDDQRSRSRSRHDSKKSSKHKRKRSHDKRSRSREHKDRGRDKRDGDRNERGDKERHRDGKARDKERDKSRSETKRKDEIHDAGSAEKGRHDHSSSAKEKKPHKDAPQLKVKPVPPKKDEDYNLIDKILEAQSTIDRILHPPETKSEPTTPVKTTVCTKLDTRSEMAQATGGPHKIQPTISIESDQEPTSTVTIPTPPEHLYQTPPDTNDSAIVWNGNITMIDVATFQIAAIPFSGDSLYIEREFPMELDIVGRISPDTVWDYINKVKRTKEIVIVRFAPHADDDESAYVTLLNYLDSRKRLGVIKSTSPAIKDFYILPLASHKSLPSVLLPISGRGFESNRPDLLLGIIVRSQNIVGLKRPPLTITKAPVVPKVSRLKSTDLSGNFTPPSSPDLNRSSLISSLAPMANHSKPYIPGDDDEPYSPGDSDDDIPMMIPTSHKKEEDDIQRKMDELNRQIELQKQEIAYIQTTSGIDEPYSPSRPVSPPMMSGDNDSNAIPGLGDIAIPTNLADILQAIKGPTPMASTSANSYMTTMACDEYTPINPAIYVTTSDYMPATTTMSNAPGKLAQMTEEELLRLVPDDSLISAPPLKKTKFDVEPLPPGVEEEEYIL